MSDQFSKAILAIYDAALSDQNWQPALYMLARESGALGAILLATDEVGLPFSVEQSSFPLEAVRFYFEHFGKYDRQVMTGPARSRPPLTVLRDVDIWEDGEELQQRPDYVWLRERAGARHRALIRLSPNCGWTDLLGLQFATGWSERAKEAEASLRRLLPHLAQAVTINRRFSILRQRHRAALAALDQIRIGTCVLSVDGEVIVANNEAERIFGLGDGLRLPPTRRIDFGREVDAVKFAAALQSVVATAGGEDRDREIVLLIPRRSGAQPFIVEVAPLRDSNAELSLGFHGALVYIIDPLNLVTISVARLAKLFAMTPAEEEVCQLMLDGLSAAEAAERREVAEGTVKTQFRSIYAKAGVSRRVDLIRLALTVDPPIR